MFGSKKTEATRKKSIIREYAEIITMAVILAFFVRSFFIQAFKIPSGSMIKTLEIGDHILVSKFSYGVKIPFTDICFLDFHKPEREDVIVFREPKQGKKDFIKRVIGLPGDTIEMKNNTLFLNGEPVGYTKIGRDYTKLLSGERRVRCILAIEDLDGVAHTVMSIPSINAMRNFGPVTVPQGSYFVLGDNRDSSRDSRYFGFVDRESIVGQAKGVIGSFNITDKYQPRFKRFFESLI